MEFTDLYIIAVVSIAWIFEGDNPSIALWIHAALRLIGPAVQVTRHRNFAAGAAGGGGRGGCPGDCNGSRGSDGSGNGSVLCMHIVAYS